MESKTLEEKGKKDRMRDSGSGLFWGYAWWMGPCLVMLQGSLGGMCRAMLVGICGRRVYSTVGIQGTHLWIGGRTLWDAGVGIAVFPVF